MSAGMVNNEKAAAPDVLFTTYNWVQDGRLFTLEIFRAFNEIDLHKCFAPDMTKLLTKQSGRELSA